jgi:hypothetical protein
VPEAVSFLLLPPLGRDVRQAGRLTGTLLGLTAVVSAGLLIGVLLVVPPLLHLLGDARYAPAALALPGLAIGMALYALYMVLEGHLVGLGHAGVHAAGITVMMLVTLGAASCSCPARGSRAAGWHLRWARQQGSERSCSSVAEPCSTPVSRGAPYLAPRGPRMLTPTQRDSKCPLAG